MKADKRYSNGFTLIEMLLVMAIVSGLLYMGVGYLQQRTQSLRIDRTSGQMQQILNAGMSYYVSNNAWPVDIAALTGTYLPSTMASPWGPSSTYTVTSTASNFYVSVGMPTKSATSVNIAKTIAGTLPLGFTATSSTATTPATCTAGGSTCYAVGTVNVPGQNLGNTKTVSFAGLYHNGACVIAPSCPTNYKEQAFAVPVAVNGFYSAPDPSSPSATCNATDKSGCIMTYYPLNGFTAYTTSDDPVTYTSGSSMPVSCGTNISSTSACDESVDSAGTKTAMTNGIRVWRVCISATTSSGDVTPTGSFANPWGQLTGTIMVITRCTPTDGATPGTSIEDTGSQFTVWQPSS